MTQPDQRRSGPGLALRDGRSLGLSGTAALGWLACWAMPPGVVPLELGRYPAGHRPESVATADLDGDGHLDAVVASAADGTVSPLLGHGDASLAPAPGGPVPAGPQPNDIAVGDFDGDGAPDLAVANHDSDRVTVLFWRRGRLVPRDGAPILVGARPHPHGIATADLDGDGDLDLALDSWEDDAVLILRGDGAGEFEPAAEPLGVGRHPYEKVRLADVNADGATDVLTANLEGGDVTILLGDGRGGFASAPGSPFPAGDAPFAVAAGDLDGDGKLDLAVANSASNTTRRGRDGLTLLRGDSRGGFAPFPGAALLPTGRAPVAVTTCDLDADGAHEAVTADYLGGSITIAAVRAGRAAGHTLPVGDSPADVACADLDGDSAAEVLVALAGEDVVLVLRAGAPRPARPPSAPASAPAPGGSSISDEPHRLICFGNEPSWGVEILAPDAAGLSLLGRPLRCGDGRAADRTRRRDPLSLPPPAGGVHRRTAGARQASAPGRRCAGRRSLVQLGSFCFGVSRAVHPSTSGESRPGNHLAFHRCALLLPARSSTNVGAPAVAQVR